MRVELPNSAFLGNLDGTFLKKLDTSNEQELQVTFNPNWTAVHPLVLAMTAALAYRIKDKGGQIKAQQPVAKSKNYLEAMKLTDVLGLEPVPVIKHESSGKFIPITKVSSSAELTKFIEEMVPLLHTSPEVADSVKYVVSELVRNVFEHANTSYGAVVCAQYFKKSKKIAVGVADTGQGIKNSINFSYPAKTDMEAIKLALTPGITGSTQKVGGTETNAGAGLFFIRSIAKINKQFFVLYSGNGFYKLLKEATGKKIRL
ncbi:MAG: sensor histidine kinase, partial [Candidatus Aenigmarchaeota archaeon]|nr:sensor histidine kinase [Candidatus Aenigmarchaeota archaeon]